MNNEALEDTKTFELFPQFDLGVDGYPSPGKVIKYYREHKTYTDTDGKEKRWTQADLAHQLHISEIMVNLMENKNQGLDSVERRRALVSILRIPPVLLGLGSLDQIVEIVTGQDVPSAKTDGKRTKIGRETIKLYKDTYKVYEVLFVEGLTYASVQDIDRWVKKIERDARIINTEDKEALLRVLWDFEILCARVYGSDTCDWGKTFEHLDNAIEIATTLGDKDLQAVSLFHSSEYRFRQGRIGLARVDMDGAMMYAEGALPQTKGAIYSGDAFLHVQSTNLSEIMLAQKMLSNAERLTGAKSEIKTIKFGKGSYYLGRAGAFLAMKRPAKALEYIDDAERYINPTKKRLLVYLDILRARCYIELRNPEYELLVTLLKGAIDDSRELRIQRHIDQIDTLYSRLTQSAYGNSPDVADLGIKLRDLKLNKI